LSRRQPDNSFLRLPILNRWVIGGTLVLACCLLTTTLSLLWITRSRSVINGPVTADLRVITVASEGRTPSPSPTVNGQAIPTPMPGEISLGAYVQIVGTGGTGLRLRDEPGLNSKVNTLGGEVEVFEVKDGPKDLDGYTWWYLVGPYDTSRHGWAVANYLKIIQNP
jgi:hypothetical protein